MNKRVPGLINGQAVEFDNKLWQVALRDCPGLKNCKFPASTEIGIGGTYEQATITMTEKGLNANMQDDEAAFEAWALALLLHCNVRSVKIGLGSDAHAKGPHYERFLYRLKRFSELFPPDRVKVDWPAVGPRALADSEKKRLLNQPNARENPPEAEFAERMSAASADASESALEKALARDFARLPKAFSS